MMETWCWQQIVGCLVTTVKCCQFKLSSIFAATFAQTNLVRRCGTSRHSAPTWKPQKRRRAWLAQPTSGTYLLVRYRIRHHQQIGVGRKQPEGLCRCYVGRAISDCCCTLFGWHCRRIANIRKICLIFVYNLLSQPLFCSHCSVLYTATTVILSFIVLCMTSSPPHATREL